jgi:hypothetical protein
MSRWKRLLFKDAAVALSHLRARLVLQRARGGEPLDGPLGQQPLTAGEATLLWLAELMARREPVTAEQQDLILTQLAGPIMQAGEAIAEDRERPKTFAVHQLIIVDNTFAGLSGRSDYLDLRTGDAIGGLPLMPVEVVSYNLNAIQTHKLASLKRAADQARRAEPCQPTSSPSTP